MIVALKVLEKAWPQNTNVLLAITTDFIRITAFSSSILFYFILTSSLFLIISDNVGKFPSVVSILWLSFIILKF